MINIVITPTFLHNCYKKIKATPIYGDCLKLRPFRCCPLFAYQINKRGEIPKLEDVGEICRDLYSQFGIDYVIGFGAGFSKVAPSKLHYDDELKYMEGYKDGKKTRIYLDKHYKVKK